MTLLFSKQVHGWLARGGRSDGRIKSSGHFRWYRENGRETGKENRLVAWRVMEHDSSVRTSRKREKAEGEVRPQGRNRSVGSETSRVA